MNNNPFAIRRSPVAVITAQAVALDDYVMRDDDGFAGIPRGGKLGVRVKTAAEASAGGEGAPIKTCKTIS